MSLGSKTVCFISLLAGEESFHPNHFELKWFKPFFKPLLLPASNIQEFASFLCHKKEEIDLSLDFVRENPMGRLRSHTMTLQLRYFATVSFNVSSVLR